MMTPPPNVKVYDWSTSIFWFDEDGILHSVSKSTNRVSIEEAKSQIEEFKKMVGDKKVCFLADATNSSETTKEVRDYAASEFPKLFKALAIISSSPLGKMLGNLFFKLKKQPYPVRMFNNENEAREWLKQYL